MIEVEVLINNFQDKENFSKKIKIKRNGIEMEVLNELLQPGDIYKVTKERYKHLSSLKIVKKVKQPKGE